jgi:serine/threonine protein kinase
MEPGEQVGSYRITRKLGEGGMGAVYEAVHTQLGRQAAIKVLHPELSKDQDTLTRFFNEARAVNIVNHPGLVQIFEFGHTPVGAAYIVMEFLAGESLRSRLKKHSGGLGLSSLIIARQLATALSATHEKHIVHRDRSQISISHLRCTARTSQRRRDTDAAPHRSHASPYSYIL